MNRNLTNERAAAIYAAMCNMNNVGGLVDVRIPSHFASQCIRVWQNDDDTICVVKGNDLDERYMSQDEFAAAYSIVN